MVSTEVRRTGRRPGDARTREQILAAAIASFSESGYESTTIRGVATAAGVDPALVHYFFGSKDRLFAAAMAVPFSPADLVERVLSGGTDGLGGRMVRGFLEVWGSPESGPPLVALLRGAASHEESARLLREFIGREVLDKIARALGVPDAEVRATLCGSQLVGLGMLRYVLKVEPIASADPEEIVGWLGPTLQRYLTGKSPDRTVG